MFCKDPDRQLEDGSTPCHTADTINKGLDKCQFSRLLPKGVYSVLYTIGSRSAREEQEVMIISKHHQSEVHSYLT